MTNISDIITRTRSDQAVIDSIHSSHIDKHDTQDSIKFDSIKFDEIFILNDNNDGKLRIGSHYINSIQVQKPTPITLDLNQIKQITFKDCKFDFLPKVTSRGIWKIQFDNCIFEESGEDWIPNILEKTKANKKVYIKNCSIESFELGDISYNSDKKLCYFELIGGSINNLIIQNIEIASKFYINKQYKNNSAKTKITNLTIDNSIFKENFKLHKCEVNCVKIEDTDFEKHADFYLSTFKNALNEDDTDKTIYFKALNFKGLALFGDCTFNEKICFKYVTFENFSHFRRAKFMNGLDLDYCNIQEEMNFFGIEGLDTEQSIKNTSQETYRIIKHNFDKIGNTIEGNNFFSLEMRKHKDQLFNSPWYKNIQKKMVFWLNEKISNFGRNYFPPIIYIIILAVCYQYIIDGTVSSFLHEYIPEINDLINNFGNKLNSFVKDIAVVKNIVTKDYEFISIIFDIILSVLVWQTIVAVKRNTKR